jgi:hypothetical protein
LRESAVAVDKRNALIAQKRAAAEALEKQETKRLKDETPPTKERLLPKVDLKHSPPSESGTETEILSPSPTPTVCLNTTEVSNESNSSISGLHETSSSSGSIPSNVIVVDKSQTEPAKEPSVHRRSNRSWSESTDDNDNNDESPQDSQHIPRTHRGRDTRHHEHSGRRHSRSRSRDRLNFVPEESVPATSFYRRDDGNAANPEHYPAHPDQVRMKSNKRIRPWSNNLS